MAEKENEKRKGAIKRRDMLKVFSAVPAAALVPLGAAVAAPQKTRGSASAGAASGYKRKAFNDHEWETINALSDLIIPADERSSSATQAGVPEFIDDWLDFRGGRLKAEILGGLTWLDLECNRVFSHDFIDSTSAQQKKILDRIAYPDKASAEDLNYVAFFNHLRDLVVGGFFSSKEGVKDLPYQGNQMVASWEGCPSNVLAQIEKNLQTKGVALSLASDKTSA
ncbi:MAG: gluconate 2-dehydrogenase subunit 3 family protein [Acidobacteria bacterium]|nr:MAG: gluconate 2-dehydrogenase subunit 3 family protein [Acidobacteriota bacterium]